MVATIGMEKLGFQVFYKKLLEPIQIGATLEGSTRLGMAIFADPVDIRSDSNETGKIRII